MDAAGAIDNGVCRMYGFYFHVHWDLSLIHISNNRQKYCLKCGKMRRERSSAIAKRRSEEREREKKRSSAIWH